MDDDTYDEISAGILDNSISINSKLGFPLQNSVDEQIDSGAANDTRITSDNPIPPIRTNTVSKSERTTVIPPPPKRPVDTPPSYQSTSGGRNPKPTRREL
jgi:hypothetical protein